MYPIIFSLIVNLSTIMAYVGKWECEFDREVRENDTLRNCVQQSEMINPLEPRDAFYGGRTEAFALFQKDQDDHTIDRVDRAGIVTV
jgi:hypothetical protein